MTRPPRLTASTDKTLPKTYDGTKIEPNYYCRGKNEKRRKWCRKRAGAGTSHKGVGRCAFHGGLQDGDKRIKSGSESRVMSTTLGELIEQERSRVDPLDLSGELATLRALVSDLRTRNPEEPDHASEITLANSIGNMVERIVKMQSSVSRSEVNRLVQELWRAVDNRVPDDKVKREIGQEWHRIGLGL